MKLPLELQPIADSLHAAAARQDFEEAAAFSDRFASSARAAAEHLPLDRRMELICEASRVLENARRRLCVARARLASRLRRIETTSEYRAPAPAAVHTWSVNG